MRLGHNALAEVGVAVPVNFGDGKPPLVSPVSREGRREEEPRDRRVRQGHEPHAFVTEHDRVPVWSVTTLNVRETHVMERVCRRLPEQSPGSLLMADGNYDAADLHRAVARPGPGCWSRSAGWPTTRTWSATC